MCYGALHAKGRDYFGYLGYVHIGMDSPLEANAKGFVDTLASIGSREIVVWEMM